MGAIEMTMKKLVDFCDEKAREELGDYYIVSKSRYDNLMDCFEKQAKLIKDQSNIISEQQDQLLLLERELMEEGE